MGETREVYRGARGCAGTLSRNFLVIVLGNTFAILVHTQMALHETAPWRFRSRRLKLPPVHSPGS